MTEISEIIEYLINQNGFRENRIIAEESILKFSNLRRPINSSDEPKISEISACIEGELFASASEKIISFDSSDEVSGNILDIIRNPETLNQ